MLLIHVSYKQLKSTTDSEQRVIHSHKVQLAIAQLISKIKDAEIKQKDYLLTKDTSFFKSYANTVEEIQHSFLRLKKLMSDNAPQRKNIDTLDYYIKQRLLFPDPLHSNDTLDLITLKEKLDRNKSMMTLLMLHTNKMMNIESLLLKEREQLHSQKTSLSPIVFLLTAGFTFLIFVLAYFKIKVDVKKLKKVNNQLNINEEIFQYSEQIAEISNWCWNLQANTFSFSKNFYNLLGCKPKEFEPTIENFLHFVHPEDQHRVEENFKKIYTEESPSVTYFRVIKKNGEIRNFKSSGKFIIDHYNKQIFIGVNADVTDQFLKDNELEDKLFDLERSNKELSAFNYVASHDLQEPLRKVQVFISRIKLTYFDVLPGNAKDYFIRIEIATNRMQKLINDLLLFSRTNKANKNFEKTNLNEILDMTKQELAEQIEEKKAVVQSSILPTLEAIPFQIQQLFNNIIGNSLKYAKSDENLKITISTKIVSGQDVPYHIIENTNKYYKISISDNGIGFDQQYANSIFTIFHRLHDNKQYSGTGIGLAICKKIVENHKGCITAEGAIGKGATFNIFLPV
ncbi:MAG TPA: ATP-binding protein [Flavobacterium sp.]